MDTSIQKVLIYGYGVMGRGVAKTFADAGFTTLVKSSRAGKLTGLPAGTVAVERLPEKAPDLVIEFVPEDVRVKQTVYAEIEAAYPGSAAGDAPLIASGTSGLDLVELARNMAHPERFLGVHYFMPADTAPVAEVMAGLATSRADVDRVADALRRTGKEPVVLYKPIVGFLVNRLQHAILHEAYYLIEAGVASAADIDHAARRMLAPRMCLNGLIQQKDISGLKIHADAQESIVPKLFHNATPNPMLQTMVALGRTGLSTGKGFYDWSGCDVEAVRKQASSQLARLLEFLQNGLGAPAPKTQPKTLPHR
ncbi:MAG TPA: 3-hydroxyacyl-CoA dehydrogenase NAD-binding domain-containing protein [Burkholderiales bacterium]|nr:3-hydroxyacyl-CoA dehydrogenase NAD-binding domain-containing protein [Burkholderiales bacterium]